jgi:hypothetical protein
MKTKYCILVSAVTLSIGLFHQKLSAEETAAPASVFMDEGEADFEMPKAQVTEAKPTKEVKHKASKSRGVANDEDDDKAAAATKGDAFDQLQIPADGAAAELPEAKAPAKQKNSKKLSQAVKVEAAPEAAPASVDPQVTEHQVEAPTLAAPTDTSAPTEVSAPKEKHHAKKHSLASAGFTQGFKTTKSGDCAMYETADKTSSQILVVKGSKKLWVEQDGEWFKAYHKKGSGYLAAECFE